MSIIINITNIEKSKKKYEKTIEKYNTIEKVYNSVRHQNIRHDIIRHQNIRHDIIRQHFPKIHPNKKKLFCMCLHKRKKNKTEEKEKNILYNDMFNSNYLIKSICKYIGPPTEDDYLNQDNHLHYRAIKIKYNIRKKHILFYDSSYENIIYFRIELNNINNQINLSFPPLKVIKMIDDLTWKEKVNNKRCLITSNYFTIHKNIIQFNNGYNKKLWLHNNTHIYGQIISKFYKIFEELEKAHKTYKKVLENSITKLNIDLYTLKSELNFQENIEFFSKN